MRPETVRRISLWGACGRGRSTGRECWVSAETSKLRDNGFNLLEQAG